MVRSTVFRSVCALAAVLAGLTASHNASAQTCGSSAGSVSLQDYYTSPTQEYCNFPYYWLTQGPGTAFIAQDQSTSTTGPTYGIMGTSFYNIGVYGLSLYGDSIGVVGLSGTSTIPSQKAAMVANASGSSVYGLYASSASKNGVYGTSGTDNAIYGDTSAQSGKGNAAVKGVSGDSSGYGVYGENSASSGNSVGVYGTSSTGYGVSGYSTGSVEGAGNGVYGSSYYGNGVYGTSHEGFAGYSRGASTARPSPAARDARPTRG